MKIEAIVAVIAIISALVVDGSVASEAVDGAEFVLQNDDVSAVSIDEHGQLTIQISEDASSSFEAFTARNISDLITVRWLGETLFTITVHDVFVTRRFSAARPALSYLDNIVRFLDATK